MRAVLLGCGKPPLSALCRQDTVCIQCANSVESLFYKGIYNVTTGISAVTKEIGNNWRSRQFICNVLYNLYFWFRFIIHDNGIIEDNPIEGKHSSNGLVPIILLSFEMGLVEVCIFNRVQNP